MSRHPDYIDRYETICCEEHVDPLYPAGSATFACTRKINHRGDHVAGAPNGVVFVTWPQERQPSLWSKLRRLVTR